MRHLALAFILTAACGGNGNDPYSSTSTPSPTPSSMTSAAACATPVSFKDDVQAKVLTACAGCHTGDSPSGGLDLSDARAYASLVGVHASEAPSKERVSKGDPEASFVWQKIAGVESPSEGVRMPRGGPFLEQAQIDAVYCWIKAGAAQN